MRVSAGVFAGLIAAALFLPCSVRADDDEKNAAKTDKTAEKPAPTEVTTAGSVDAGGQHIVYNATVGTITVGRTTIRIRSSGMTGNRCRAASSPMQSPRMRRTHLPRRVCLTSPTSRKTRSPRSARSPSSITAARGVRRCGCTWVRWDRSTWSRAAISICRRRLTGWSENAYSLLDVSDLVFIDMPGTGFGRLMGKDAEKAFWGVDQDANAFARFIARFITKFNRWNSPKYIFGESYGTTRSAVLADVLENNKSIDINGVILLSQIFNFTTDIDMPTSNPGVDLPYELALPTYAATAWYHKRVPPQPSALEPSSKKWRTSRWARMPTRWRRARTSPDEEKRSVAEKLHGYIGLPVAYILKANLRVNGGEFEKTLQDEQDLTTGRLDTRFSGPHMDPLSQDAEYDPQSSAISSAYVSLFNDYVRKDLKYGEGQTYLPQALFGGDSRGT